MFLYVTCDRIGSETGGGAVTAHELTALRSLGHVDIINPDPNQNPFVPDQLLPNADYSKYKLAHFYSGTFPKLTEKLKAQGVKITYTAAAHDIKLSQEEFEKNNIPYDFPHLTNPEILNQYLISYRNADLVICPSKHSGQIMNNFGCKNVSVIPHGCKTGSILPSPKKFAVGYLGQIGPDKGVRYLIEAWAKLNYKDSILYFAGAQSPELIHLIRQYDRGNFIILGFVKRLEEFFRSISVYIQPSVTEGFGIEVLEAMSFGRPVIASDGVGSIDCLNNSCKVVPKRNFNAIADAIDSYKSNTFTAAQELHDWSKNYSWDKVRNLYAETWKEMLNAI